jgi:dihydropteroate synthase
MPRKLYYWKLNNRELALGQRTVIAGVLNLTPDSFHDGGRYQEPDRAFAHALELEEQGAGMLDIGAESTRPGSNRVTAAIELQRLVPVLKRLRDKLRIPISVDTYKSEVAERALDLGADIINDPSGLTLDPALAKVVVQHNAGVILNHMRGNPESWSRLAPLPDVMGTIVKELEATVSRARRAGIDKARIVIDPGLGFGKRKEQNSEILARLSELSQLDLPIMAGPSYKSFLTQPTPAGTQFATASAVAASILGGAHIVRVHDVAEMHAVATIADEVAKSATLLPHAG